MEWFESVVAGVHLVPLDTLPLRPILALCRRIVAGYPILYSSGLISKILSDDLNSNVDKVERALAEMEREALVDRQLACGSDAAGPTGSAAGDGGGGSGGGAPTAGAEAGGAASPPPPASPPSSQRSTTSRPGLGYAPAVGPYFADLADFSPTPSAEGVYGARWIVRVLRFVVLLLQKLGSEPALSISLAGRQTYTAIIAPHHAPVMGFVVKCVLYWAPTRAWVLHNTLKGASNADASAACLRVSAALGPLAEACHALLVRRGLNFHDIISAVPGGF